MTIEWTDEACSAARSAWTEVPSNNLKAWRAALKAATFAQGLNVTPLPVVKRQIVEMIATPANNHTRPCLVLRYDDGTVMIAPINNDIEWADVTPHDGGGT